MTYWKEVLTHFTPDAEARMAELRGLLDAQLGGCGPLKVIAFRGYGSPEHLFLRGRVIEEKTVLAGAKDDRVWANLVRIYTHAQAEPVPHAILAARFQDSEQILTTDEDGFFEVRFHPARPLVEQRIWHPVELHLVSPIHEIQSRYPIKATGQVLVPSAGARYGLISAIDSTLLPASGSTDLTYLARSAFLRAPHARLSFPGEAALYQAFYGGLSGAELNPIFYVSSSSSELYDLLVQHMNLQSLPNGPVLFARSDLAGRIRRILQFYPRLPFLLTGGADEKTAEIFTSLACEFPGRIPAIYLRVPAGGQGRVERLPALAEKARRVGSRLVLAENALGLARQAVKQGFLAPAALAGIAVNAQKDQCPLSPLEALLFEAGETRDREAKISPQAVKKSQHAPETSEVTQWPVQKPSFRRSNKKNK